MINHSMVRLSIKSSRIAKTMCWLVMMLTSRFMPNQLALKSSRENRVRKKILTSIVMSVWISLRNRVTVHLGLIEVLLLKPRTTKVVLIRTGFQRIVMNVILMKRTKNMRKVSILFLITSKKILLILIRNLEGPRNHHC